MTMPVVDVSVVIPFYRGADTIERAVRSIAAQTRRPREIVVVDDGSPEPLPEIASDVPLRRVRHETNRGIPAARNTGIRAAAGSWIGFLDQDDEWVEDKLERQWAVAQAAAGDEPPVVFGRLFHTGAGRAPWVWPRKRSIAPLERGGDAALREIMRSGNAAPMVTLLVARATLERHGELDESLRGGSDDYEYLLRVVAAGVPLRYDGGGREGYSAVHHFTGSNYSAHAPRFLKDDLELVDALARRYPLVARRADRLKARTHYMLARHHDRAGERAAASTHYAQASRLDPAWPPPRLARMALALPQPVRDRMTALRERLRGLA